ncbi:MAG TPA: gamma-glutamyl-gamma-aminobutyrate hydrolase family protein [Acidobacteriota bacterium]|jgi:putative glutamine amidotransferase
MDNSRPLIGITTRHEPGRIDFYLQRHYPEAVYQAGGLPLLIPLIEDPAYLNSVMRSLDGMIFSGSRTDVDPERYGQQPAQGLGIVNPLRDSVDMHLAREAMQMDMPVFGICYGFQMLNVALGGSLIQDLPQRPGGIRHNREDSSQPIPQHAVALSPGTVLEKLAGDHTAQVNSTHHQAVDRLAEDLTLAALSPDGVIEAAVHRSGRPMIAVQWHPERSFSEDQFSKRLFEHFVALCREFRQTKTKSKV